MGSILRPSRVRIGSLRSAGTAWTLGHFEERVSNPVALGSSQRITGRLVHALVDPLSSISEIVVSPPLRVSWVGASVQAKASRPVRRNVHVSTPEPVVCDAPVRERVLAFFDVRWGLWWWVRRGWRRWRWERRGRRSRHSRKDDLVRIQCTQEESGRPVNRADLVVSGGQVQAVVGDRVPVCAGGQVEAAVGAKPCHRNSVTIHHGYV